MLTDGRHLPDFAFTHDLADLLIADLERVRPACTTSLLHSGGDKPRFSHGAYTSAHHGTAGDPRTAR